jgi:hypothetical protein
MYGGFSRWPLPAACLMSSAARCLETLACASNGSRSGPGCTTAQQCPRASSTLASGAAHPGAQGSPGTPALLPRHQPSRSTNALAIKVPESECLLPPLPTIELAVMRSHLGESKQVRMLPPVPQGWSPKACQGG